MAEEQTEAVQDQEASSEGQEEVASKPRGPLIPPIVLRLAVVGGILAVLAVGAIFLVTDVIAPRVHAIGEAPVPEEETHTVKELGTPALLTVSDLIVNPAGTGGRRYLKVTAAVEMYVADGKGKEKKEGHGGAGGLQEIQIRDLFIRELSARTLEELTNPISKEEMRQSLLAELNEMLGEGRVTNLYFTEYVVQ